MKKDVKKIICLFFMVGLVFMFSSCSKGNEKSDDIFPTVQGEYNKKPTLVFNNKLDSAPTELEKKVLKQGTGKTVKAGETLTINYYGAVYGETTPFDNSYDRGEPASFQIGVGQLIKGWDQGLVGEKVGSRVILVIPPALGYGEHGSPPTIPGNSTLVFVCDIIDSK